MTSVHEAPGVEETVTESKPLSEVELDRINA
jgi:hypothetical protein